MISTISRNRISIVTVCLNAQSTIEKTIKSVAEQVNALSYEYIIKDGSSSDDTNKIIDSYSEIFLGKKIAFKHIICKDEGIYEAMNQAVSYCSGEYIIFLNAGDIFYNDRILETIECMDTDADIIYGDTIMSDKEEDTLFRADMRLINRRMPYSHQSCFAKRNLLTDYVFQDQYLICADYDWTLHWYREAKVFKNANIIISVYDLYGLSSTNFIPKMKEHLNILQKYCLINKISFYYFIKMFEAKSKNCLYKYIGSEHLKILKKWYKKNVKKYESLKTSIS